MKRPTLFAIDFETTGTDATRDYPHELALRVLRADKRGHYEVAERKEWRIKVPRKARRLPGFYGAMRYHQVPSEILFNVGDEPQRVALAVRDLAKLHTLDGRAPMLAAQNLSFDAAFMRRLFDLGFRDGRAQYPFGYHGVDLTGLAVMLAGTHRFKDTVKALGVENRDAHTAGGDADMLADCLVKLSRHARFDRHMMNGGSA